MKTPHKSSKALAAALALTLAALATAAFARASQQSSTQSSQNSHPLDALDRAVQKRFHNVIGFGMARIGTEKRVAPETEEEKGSVRGLKREGYSVGLYLAGRAILSDVPEANRYPKRTFGSSPAGQAFSGPVFLSSSGLKGLPAAASRWGETRRGFQSV